MAVAKDARRATIVKIPRTDPTAAGCEKLAPFVSRGDSSVQALKMVYRPFLMMRFPVIVFAGFIYGCYLCWFALVNATVSIFLASPPYNFSASVSQPPSEFQCPRFADWE